MSGSSKLFIGSSASIGGGSMNMDNNSILYGQVQMGDQSRLDMIDDAYARGIVNIGGGQIKLAGETQLEFNSYLIVQGKSKLTFFSGWSDASISILGEAANQLTINNPPNEENKSIRNQVKLESYEEKAIIVTISNSSLFENSQPLFVTQSFRNSSPIPAVVTIENSTITGRAFSHSGNLTIQNSEISGSAGASFGGKTTIIGSTVSGGLATNGNSTSTMSNSIHRGIATSRRDSSSTTPFLTNLKGIDSGPDSQIVVESGLGPFTLNLENTKITGSIGVAASGPVSISDSNGIISGGIVFNGSGTGEAELNLTSTSLSGSLSLSGGSGLLSVSLNSSQVQGEINIGVTNGLSFSASGSEFGPGSVYTIGSATPGAFSHTAIGNHGSYTCNYRDVLCPPKDVCKDGFYRMTEEGNSYSYCPEN